MAIEVSAFNDAARINRRLALADNANGEPTIISAKEGFKEKVLSMLSHIPLLKDTTAVQGYVNGLSIDNRQVLGIFLHALATRFGNDAAFTASKQLDLSGQTPLNARIIKQITTEAEKPQSANSTRQSVCNRENTPMPTDGKAISVLRGRLGGGLASQAVSNRGQVNGADDNFEAERPQKGRIEDEFNQQNRDLLKLNRDIKHVQDQGVLQFLLEPKAQSWLASWVYSESKPVQALQSEVVNFNQLLSETKLVSQFDGLTSVHDLKADPAMISARVNKLERDCSKLNHALETLAGSVSAMSPAYCDAVAPLLNSINRQRVVCEELTLAVHTLSQSLSDTVSLRQNIANFNALLPESLQGKLDSSQLLSCYRMFSTLIADAKIDPMASHLAQCLSQGGDHSSEALPDVKTLVQLVYHFCSEHLNMDNREAGLSSAHQVLTYVEAAQVFVDKVLTEAKNLHDTKMESVKQEVQLEAKSSEMGQSAAILSQILRDASGIDHDKVKAEDETYASLLYFVGQDVVAKRDRLMFDFPVIAENLNLAKGIEAELNGAVNPNIAKCAKNVLQAQHQLAWHRGESSVSHSPNNKQNIHLDRDISQLQLATQIARNKADYLSFISERQPMCEAYHDTLVDLISTLVAEQKFEGKISGQLNALLAEVKLERNANASLLSAIDKVQKAEDILVIAGNQNQRLAVMSQDLKRYARETKAERANINLQAYLHFLPELRANNDEVRELTEQQHILIESVSRREAHLIEIYGGRLTQKLAEPQLGSPELRAYCDEKSQLRFVQSKLSALDDDYQVRLLELKKAMLVAQRHGGYPEQGRASSAESWQSWVVQKFVGTWSASYRPSIEELILERQLAKNNMDNMGQAYLALAKTVRDPKSSLSPMFATASLMSPKGVVSALGELHNWSMAHPVEARELAGNLTQAYHIIMANPGTFGQELVNTVKTVWQTGTVQNQVHDILNGTREELPDKANISMTPEMIALLHMAQMAPYVVGGAKGAVNAAIGGPVLVNVFTTMLPAGGVIAPMVGLVGGLLQTWSERQLANNMSAYRSTEVMVNALIKGMQSEGGLGARGQTVASYMMQRQALQEVGTIARDSFEVGKVGAMQRFFSDFINVWKNSTSSAKVFTVLTTVLAGGVLSASAVAVALLILGTGGIGIGVAVGLGVGGAAVGGVLAKSLRLALLDTHFLGMHDTARKVEKEMTMNRIEQALERLSKNSLTNNIKGANTLGELLALNSSDTDQTALVEGLVAELVDVAPDKQAKVFSNLMAIQANKQSTELNQVFDHHNRNIIEKAQQQLSGLEFSDEDLKVCMAEIDTALK